MLVKNNVARLITINTAKTVKYDKYDKDGKPESDAKVIDVQAGVSFDINPASAAVKVPESVLKCEKALEYLESLVKSGDVVEVSEKAAQANDYNNMSREDLESVAGAYGVTFNANTKNETLIKAIEKAEKGE